ncbi:DUF2061 domain-containing protein [Hirschia litorea]
MNRDVIKTISYGVMHFTVAIAVAFALTQDWRIALSVGLIEPFVQTFAYSIHERVWQRGQKTKSANEMREHLHGHIGLA